MQAASDVYSPISGEVVEVNSSLVDDPSKVAPPLPAWPWPALLLSEGSTLTPAMPVPPPGVCR